MSTLAPFNAADATETTDATFGDLASCNTEPLRFLTHVQSRGALIAFTPNDKRIQAASSNVENFLRQPYREVLGARLDQVFDASFCTDVDEAVRAYPWREAHGRELYCEIGGRGLSVYLFASEGAYCLEFEIPELDTDALRERRRIDRLVNEYLGASKNAETPTALAQAVCRGVREVTGMDRVMMYRFNKPTWDGIVVAEDRVIQAHSYNNHRFPASDIPQQARDLYLENSVRVISDVESTDVAIDPPMNPLTRKPLNLSDSRLRAVSPIHVEYLKNMGVRSSLSVAVIHKGELWGLIACHNVDRPLTLSSAARHACELMANAFAGQNQLLETLIQNDRASQFDACAKKLIREITGYSAPVDELLRRHQLAQELFHAQGLAYVNLQGKRVDFAGLTPPRAALVEIAKFLETKVRESSRGVFVSNSLASLDERWGSYANVACGVLAFELKPGELLIVFRGESIQKTTWGGDPRKALAKKNFAGRINPRLSFESLELIIRNHSEPWHEHETAGAEFLRDYLRNLTQRAAGAPTT